ncbi:MAG: DpnD/PcfM family protein [Firmicutes bacterium]|nr:DpnD/PcfM family protein [Bacillota bacterium]
MKQNNPKQKKERVFRVTITETLKRTILVREGELKEPTADDAAQTVSDWWHQGQIILEADDFTDVDFSAEEVREGGEDGE